MTISFWCVMVAGLMPIFCTFVAKLGPGSDFKNYNNNAPRKYLNDVTGMAERANWAQQNSWEAFSPFAAAVIISTIAGLEFKVIDLLAMTFILARLVYILAYVFDKPAVRSFAWILGFGITIMLYVLAAKVYI